MNTELSPNTGGDDEVGVDVGRFMATLWRRRVVILLVTLLGGALGLMYVRLTPKRYVGRTQVIVLQSAGPALAADAVATFQSALTDAALLTRVLADAQLPAVPPTELRPAVSTRLIPPGNRLLVEVEWRDSAAAVALANAATRRAFEASRERQSTKTSTAQSVLDKDAAEADLKVEIATAALTALRKSGAMDASRAALDFQTARRRDLQEALTDITTERGRLSMLQERRRQVEATNPEYSAVAERIVASESRLAGLTARREYLENLLKGQSPERIIGEITDLELRQTRLQTDLNRAQQVRDRLVDAAAAARRNGLAQAGGLELNADSEASVRSVGPTATAGVTRGLALGFVLAAFVVFFANGLLSSLLNRRT